MRANNIIPFCAGKKRDRLQLAKTSNNPWCLTCRRSMKRAGSQNGITRFSCLRCRTFVQHRNVTAGRSFWNPVCLSCRKSMHKAAKPKAAREQTFTCVRCRFTIRAATTTRAVPEFLLPETDNALPVQPEALLREIDSRLSAYPAEMREELRSEIALAILTTAAVKQRRITSANLNITAANIKHIARPLYRASNRFRFVSLDHRCSKSSQRLEERLAG